MAAIDLGLFFHALGSYFVGPGEHQHRYEEHGPCKQEYGEHPLRCADIIYGYIRDLKDKPRGHDIGNSNANNVATFQFVKQLPQCHPPGA